MQGDCPMPQPVTQVEVGQHMHFLGTHMKVTVHGTTMGELVIHDAPYTFDEQSRKYFDPIEMARGDTISVECTFMNGTDHTVGFSQSSTDEICYAAAVRYPVAGSRCVE